MKMQLKNRAAEPNLKQSGYSWKLLKVVEMELESNQKADDVLKQSKRSQNAVKMQLRSRAAKIQ